MLFNKLRLVHEDNQGGDINHHSHVSNWGHGKTTILKK